MQTAKASLPLPFCLASETLEIVIFITICEDNVKAYSY